MCLWSLKVKRYVRNVLLWWVLFVINLYYLTCIQVWNTAYPCTLKYYADMKEYTWKYTQFSQFNSSDTLLLVSGVHFGSHSTSGEIAVFSIDCKLKINCLQSTLSSSCAWFSAFLVGILH